jgi:hypothetical protein
MGRINRRNLRRRNIVRETLRRIIAHVKTYVDRRDAENAEGAQSQFGSLFTFLFLSAKPPRSRRLCGEGNLCDQLQTYLPR